MKKENPSAGQLIAEWGRTPTQIRCAHCNMIVWDSRDGERPLPIVEYQWMAESTKHSPECTYINYRGELIFCA